MRYPDKSPLADDEPVAEIKAVIAELRSVGDRAPSAATAAGRSRRAGQQDGAYKARTDGAGRPALPDLEAVVRHRRPQTRHQTDLRPRSQDRRSELANYTPTGRR